jgi:cytidine deaminase
LSDFETSEAVILPLVIAAREARELAIAPYSQFKVGAALRTASGVVYRGCNIESASYGLTVCAERVALLKALSEGERDFTTIVIAADTFEPTPPCGACRQLLWEYCGTILVILANLSKVCGWYQLEDLLPLPFDARALK